MAGWGLRGSWKPVAVRVVGEESLAGWGVVASFCFGGLLCWVGEWSTLRGSFLVLISCLLFGALYIVMHY